MDFKKLSQENIELILEKLENQASKQEILALFDPTLHTEVAAFVTFEKALKQNLEQITPSKALLSSILFKLPKASVAVKSKRGVLSPFFLGKIFAPVAVFALILILTQNNPFEQKNDGVATTQTTEEASKRSFAPTAMKVASAPITKEQKREKANEIVAGFNKVATAAPAQEQATPAQTSAISSPSFNALYE